ncbi:MAG: prepilin peptidase [Acidobacteriota bacterium]|nr:prepilin peptidase [Acidobacteriota bacterium]
MDLTIECVLFITGLVFGSFLNVCISRIPREQSVVSPGSHCPSCGASVRWRDNIPLLSWALLRGRCRHCRAPISWRYPAVELLTGTLFSACFPYFGASWLTLKLCIFCFLLVGLIFMDAETGLLPREFTYSGIVLGFVLSWVAPTDTAGTQFLLRLYDASLSSKGLALLDAALGALVGAGFFYLAWAVYYLVRKRHGMGFGDVALMAMAGTFLGLKLTLLVSFCAPVLAMLYSILILAVPALRATALGSEFNAGPDVGARDSFLTHEIPFGVFLGACSLGAVFFGEWMWRWYLGFFR